MTTATIFFKFKKEYQEKFVYEKGLVEKCKERWPKEFALASYLLGLILGHEKTFDCLYNTLPLKIFNMRLNHIQAVSSDVNIYSNPEPKQIPNEDGAAFVKK